MWVERVEIAGFGRLAGEFRFEPGLTVVCGPNEAGKSTLHDALVRSIFGFTDKERKRRGGESVMLRRAPWGGGPFGLVAHVHLAGDRPLRIEWTFGPEREQALVLRDARSGEDLGREVAAKGGSYALGEYLLGVDLDSYRRWGCLEQASGARVKGDEGFVDALRNATETGSEDAGVDVARKLIEDARRSEAIGARAGTHTPLKDRAYAIAIARRDELDAWIKDAEAVQGDLAAEACGLERLEAEGAELRGRIAELEQERLLARRQSLGMTIERACEAGERVGRADVDAPPEVPAEAANEARALHARIEELRAARARATASRDAAAGELTKLVGEAALLDAEIRSLAAYESVDASQEGRIGELLGGLGERELTLAGIEARGADGGGPSVGPPGGRAVDGAGTGTGDPRAESEIAAGGGPGQAGPGVLGDGSGLATGTDWVLPAGVAVASLLGGVLVSPALFAGLLVAAVLLWWLRERRRGGEAALARREAEREALRAGAAQAAQREAGERARAGAEARVRERREELDAALDALAVTPGEVRARAESYLEACRQTEHLARLKGRRSGLAERQRTLSEPAAEIERIDGEFAERGARLKELLHRLGISVDADAASGSAMGSAVGSDWAEAIAELEAMEAAAGKAREQRAAAQEAGESLRTILNGRTLEELEASLRDVEGELNGHRAKHGTFDLTPRSEQQVTEDLDVATAARADAARRLGTAGQKVADLEERLADLPSRRAEREQAKERIERIEFAIDALAIAAEELEEAAKEAHRKSVPGLNRAINEELPRLTEGRYTEATVGEDLQVTLIAPEINRAVSADRLSQGTQQQIYLVQRFAILELLSRSATEPPPLLLDDAFAHFDADRRRAALELLAEKAEQRQIVLFVDEPEVAEELEALGADFGTVELVGPAGRVGV